MLEAIANRLRNDVETGVPRRFSVGEIFVLLTVYAVLFRLFALIGASPELTSLGFVFAALVTVAQMWLFGGTKPRAASVVAGAMAAPMMYGVLAIDQAVTRWSGIMPVREGYAYIGAQLSLVCLLVIFGSFGGYLCGAMLAGVFWILKLIRPDAGVATSPAARSPESSDESSLLRMVDSVGRWINPIPKGNPFRGALALFEICFVLGVLLAPFVNGFAWHHVVLVFTAMGLLIAFLSANCELLIFWPVAMAVIGYLLAPQLYESVVALPFISANFEPPDSPPTFFRIGCAFVGVMYSALIGWLQWAVLRAKEKVRFGPIAFALACGGMVMLVFLAANRIDAYGNSPEQQLLTAIHEKGGYVAWNFDQSIQSVHFPSGFDDDDFFRLLPRMDGVMDLSLQGSGFTNKSVAALDGMVLQAMHFVDVPFRPDAFGSLSSFSTQHLSFSNCDLSAEVMNDLVRDKNMQGALAGITLMRMDLSEEVLKPLSQCGGINFINISHCSLDEETILSLGEITPLTVLHMADCGMDDADIKSLAATLPPTVEILGLKNNDISDAGLLELAQPRKIGRIQLQGNTRLTRDGVNALQKQLPNCFIDWSDPDQE